MTTNRSRELSKHHGTIARRAWELALELATSRGFAPVHDRDYGDGFYIMGTVSSFVRAASSDVGGDPINTPDVSDIRAFLKVTGNVVVKHRIDTADQSHAFKLFVRAEWCDDIVVPHVAGPKQPDAIDRRAARLTEQEAGEDREPAPVTVKKTAAAAGNGGSGKDGRASKRRLVKDVPAPGLTDKRLHVLQAIDEIGAGVVESSSGKVNTIIREWLVANLPGFAARNYNSRTSYVTTGLQGLDDLGFIVRESSARRRETRRVEITATGRKALGGKPGGQRHKGRTSKKAPAPVPAPASVPVPVPDTDVAAVVTALKNVLRQEVEAELQAVYTGAEQTVDKIAGVLAGLNDGKHTPLAALALIDRIVKDHVDAT